jgi:non-ribosomal peptide synthase protein (TIGR01720 family)
MSIWNERIRNLSPEQRQLLDALLNRDGPDRPTSTDKVYTAPRSRVEEQLASIWSNVLGISRIGVDENFFDLGGDSIQSIRIVAKAREVGLKLTTALLFANPTIAGLTAAAGEAEEINAQQDVVTGPVMLSPIQHWFFEMDLPDPGHWNQTMLFEVAPAVSETYLRRACDAIVEHHDALRLHFEKVDGQCVQTCHPVRPAEFAALSVVREEEAQHALRSASGRFELSGGVLFRALLLHGPGNRRRLLIVANHLAVDGLSFRIIAEDLQHACESLARGEPVQLPLKTTSVQTWAERWMASADREEVRMQESYWTALAATNTPPLPCDNHGANLESEAETFTSDLDADVTLHLLRLAPSQYRSQFMEVLLAAVTLGLARWSGQEFVWLDCESHGRANLPGVDLSRTAGWFTAMFPIAACPGGSFTNALADIKRVFQQLPEKGMGFGLLRYGSSDPEVRKRLARLPRREVLFNYLGHFDDSARTIPWFRYIPEFSSGAYGPTNPRPHILQIYGGIVEGRLRLNWTYCRNLHSRDTIENLAGGVVDTLRMAAGERAALTPAHFPDAELTPEDLRQILAAHS